MSCAICCETKNRRYYKITSNCNHDANVCVECVNKYIETSIENQSFKIKCLTTGCDNLMERHDIKKIATKEIFEKYDSFSFKHAIKEIPEFRWCQAGCGSGQIHKGKDPIVICKKCRAMSCYIHDVLWHEKVTCEEYKRPSDAATEIHLSQSSGTNKCPHCDMYIEKKGGCNYMKCKCSRDFNFK